MGLGSLFVSLPFDMECTGQGSLFSRGYDLLYPDHLSAQSRLGSQGVAISRWTLAFKRSSFKPIRSSRAEVYLTSAFSRRSAEAVFTTQFPLWLTAATLSALRTADSLY
jgi:hypothetical protein